MKYYLFGLQRSGTNILEMYIKDNFRMDIHINQKHIDLNRFKKLEDLDNYIGERGHNCRYVVILKDIYSWLLSIERWANKKRWEKRDKMDFVKDYLEYIKRWNEIKTERVLIVNYIDFLRNYKDRETLFIRKMEDFLGKRCNENPIKRDSVKCSGRWGRNEQYYLKRRFMDRYSQNERILIEKLKKEIL